MGGSIPSLLQLAKTTSGSSWKKVLLLSARALVHVKRHYMWVSDSMRTCSSAALCEAKLTIAAKMNSCQECMDVLPCSPQLQLYFNTKQIIHIDSNTHAHTRTCDLDNGSCLWVQPSCCCLWLWSILWVFWHFDIVHMTAYRQGGKVNVFHFRLLYVRLYIPI